MLQRCSQAHFISWSQGCSLLQVLQAELEDEKEGAEQQRMAAQADLTHFRAKLATQDSEVISLRNELESELHQRTQAKAQHEATQADLADQLAFAAAEAQKLNSKHTELLSQVRC